MQTTITAPTTYRILVGQYRVDTGARVSGFTIKVDADTREEAATMAVARAREIDRESVDRHNVYAERFGTWTMPQGAWDFQAERVRKAPVRR